MKMGIAFFKNQPKLNNIPRCKKRQDTPFGCLWHVRPTSPLPQILRRNLGKKHEKTGWGWSRCRRRASGQPSMNGENL